MSPEVAALRQRTPVTEALVASMLKRTGQVGLGFNDNQHAYWWRMFEIAHPWRARLNALFSLGPRIAFARSRLAICPKTVSLFLNGLPVFISPMLPHRSTQLGPMRLSPFVTVSDEFRARTDAWLADFFGTVHSPQPCLAHAYKGYGMVFVSPQMAEQLRRYPRITEYSEIR